MPPLPRRSITVAFVLLAVAAVVGSGAFSAVTADRSATVDVAGDDSALLAITPFSPAPSGVTFGSGGTFSLQVSPGATTTYAGLFNVTNQGTQPVSVWIVDHDYTGGGSFGNLPGDIVGDVDKNNTGNVTFFNLAYGGNATCENGVPSVEGQPNAVELAAGHTLVVGMQANTSDVSGEEADLLDEITIHADASVPGVSAPINRAC